eukprot:7648971-Pyramimonas_sp.AAC.1
MGSATFPRRTSMGALGSEGRGPCGRFFVDWPPPVARRARRPPVPISPRMRHRVRRAANLLDLSILIVCNTTALVMLMLMHHIWRN